MADWGLKDYEDLHALHTEAAENFNDDHPNGRLAKTLFVSAHNLHDFNAHTFSEMGNFVDDQNMLQVVYLQRGPPALFSLYWMIEHHHYSTAYSRVRFLLELYLVVRKLNRDKDWSATKYQQKRKELHKVGPEEDNPVTEFFGGVRGNVLGEFKQRDDLNKTIHSMLSNFGSHPNSFRAAHYDGKRRAPDMERDALALGCEFSYGLASQYIRTFEHTDAGKSVHRYFLDLIEDIYATNIPILSAFDEDLEYLIP